MLFENMTVKHSDIIRQVVLVVMGLVVVLLMTGVTSFAQDESGLTVPAEVGEELLEVKHLGGLTVNAVQQLAALGHPDLAAAEFNVQAAEALQKKAESGLYPHLTYSLSARKYNDDQGLEGVKIGGQRIDIPFHGDQGYGATLCLDYNLIDWGQTRYRIDAAQHEKVVRQEGVRSLKQRAIQNAVSAYYTLVSAKESQHYLSVTIKELQDFSRVAHRDNRIGKANAPQKDIIRIEMEITKMSAWVDTLQRWAENARQSLAFAIGQPNALITVVDDRIMYDGKLISFERSLQTALANRPELQILESRYAELEARAQAQRRSNWPQLNIRAKGVYDEDDYGPSQNSFAVVGLFVDGVLFDGFQNKGATQAIMAEAKAVKKELKAQQGRIRKEVMFAWQKIRTTFGTIVKYQQARDLSLDRLGKVRKGYALQLSDVEDVLDAMVERRMRDKDYLFAKLQLMQAVARMNQVCSAPLYQFADNVDQKVR